MESIGSIVHQWLCGVLLGMASSSDAKLHGQCSVGIGHTGWRNRVKAGSSSVLGLPRPYLPTVSEGRFDLPSADRSQAVGEMLIELENIRRFALVNLFFRGETNPTPLLQK
jgi:hypothetical protein